MTLIWLIVWLIQGHPAITVAPSLNTWALTFALCAIADIAASK